MKIGIDIRTLMDKRYFGVSGYTKRLVAKILEIDNKNDYKLFYNSFYGDNRRIPQYIGDNIEIVRTKIPNKCFNYCLTKIFKRPLLDEMLGVDVFFMPHLNFVSLSPGSKKIIAIHDLSFLRYREFFSWRQNIWHQLVNVRSLLKQFDIIIAMSQNTKKDIVELCNIEPQKIKVIYSGIADIFCEINKNNEQDLNKIKKIRQKYNLPAKFFLQQGAIEPRKNVISTIDAFELICKKFPIAGDLHLVIAGGKGWKNKQVFAKAKKSRFASKIHFPGYIDDFDLPYIYNLAKALIYPSFYEGFGFPPLEAMSCGTAVIAANIGSLPEILGKSALLVNPFNINEIAKAMEVFLTNPEVIAKYQKRGFITAKKYKWEFTAKKYIETFVSSKK